MACIGNELLLFLVTFLNRINNSFGKKYGNEEKNHQSNSPNNQRISKPGIGIGINNCVVHKGN